MLQGTVHPDFGLVAHRLKRVLPENGHGGAAVTVYHRGEKVVDLWGGTINADLAPWQEDTVSLSFSTTKGMASTLLHILIDEGRANYDDPVSKHWPEFGKNGKDKITIRQVMCHEAGLYHLRDMVEDASEMLDWPTMISRLENAKPVHKPGAAHGYHALTYGWLVGELAQRLGQDTFQNLLQDRLAGPLGLDGLYCGLPDEHRHRHAPLRTPSSNAGNSDSVIPTRRNPRQMRAIRNVIRTVSLGKLDPRESKRALVAKGMMNFDFNADATLDAVIPAANGCFTARSLARVYAALANGGEIDGVRIISEDGIKRATKVQNKTPDRVLMVPMQWRLGYHRVFDFVGPKAPNAFGHFGFGGSGAWADPSRNLSFALTLNHGVGTPAGDNRTMMMSRATLKAADMRR